MASTYETGHIKNAENFSKLVTEVTGFGATYNPTAADLLLTALQTKDTAVQSKMSTVNSTIGSWKAKINDRQYAYEKMDTLGSRAVAHAASIDLNAKILADLKTIQKDIRGKRKKLPPEPEPIPQGSPAPVPVKTISVAQTSFDKRKDHFNNLIALLKTITAYNPNETDIKINSLTTYAASLKTVNTDVNTAANTLFNARKTRNVELYKEKTGAVDIALRVKEYVKGMLPAGASSPEYQRIKAIKFKDLAFNEKQSQ